LDLMEPEETFGNLWHDIARGFDDSVSFPDAEVRLGDVRPSLTLLFRALGGDASVEITEAPASVIRHRLGLRQKLSTDKNQQHLARFDGEALRLPPAIACFAERDLNRAAYFWLTALAALLPASVIAGVLRLPPSTQEHDLAAIRANAIGADLVLRQCPGLRKAFRRMAALAAQSRVRLPLPASGAEAEVEACVRDQLRGKPIAPVAAHPPIRGYQPFLPVPFWLCFETAGAGRSAAEEAADARQAPAAAATSKRKFGERKDQDQTNRRDSFIIHRFEAILSWVESMNINRSVDDDEEDNAQKAADDQEKIVLSKHDRKAATRLRLHLDLSPSDADHEALAGEHVYPEWNHRARAYMEGHCRVLDAPAEPSQSDDFRPDPRYIRAVRRQFEALRPRRLLRPRQIEGSELDLEALICAQADLKATGQGSDRIWQDARQTERDLAVAFLIDTSRSTEAAIGDTAVIDVAREAMAALAHGIDAAGDRLGIWGFSSLRRDRVFLTRVKDFSTPMGPAVVGNIASLKPSHYTRLGAAIRHVSAELAREGAARKLLIVLTDGKPNDLDHYEGQHGIEDSRMAVREARHLGLSLHGVVIDEDGQDWFARIFGRGGFTLLPHPERLTRALPDIYRTLTQET
ncbi:nitric oxide reductase activation protein NorD, partial [Hoeflea olei]|uniref:nitric oxide reductase activation protein NorD n=1 Tax=Hoeflea olei TaxID=1480615 RepID=UPI000826954F